MVSPIDVLRVINGLKSKPVGSPLAERTEGEAAPAPAGFLSIAMRQMPGSVGQIVPLTSNLNVGREGFNEMGIFAADNASGFIDGIAPGEPGYAEAVFNSSQRLVLYSRFDTFRTASALNLPAGSYARVSICEFVQ